jgi:hypothetical protein
MAAHSTLWTVQKLQNNAACLVLKIRKSECISPHLQFLHWLPVDSRIKYKISCLAFGAITGTGPLYLFDLVHTYTPARQRGCLVDYVLFGF